jgi:hypothetical protein
MKRRMTREKRIKKEAKVRKEEKEVKRKVIPTIERN